MKLSDMYFTSFVFWCEILAVSSTSNYFHGLIKYLKEESKLHQVVFIIDDSLNNTDPVMDSLMTTVNSHFPSFSIGYTDMIDNNLDELHIKFLNRPRSTTLFVLQWSNEDTLFKFDDFLIKNNDFLLGSSKPRCLVLNSSPTSEDIINETLHNFFKFDYVDITLLTYDNQQLQKKIESSAPVAPILNHMNPFFKTFSSQQVSSKSKWFPDKLLDLNGYKFYVFFQPLNDSSVGEYRRVEKLLNILSHSMNFTPERLEYPMPTGKLNFGANESETERLFQELEMKLSNKSVVWLHMGATYSNCCLENFNLRFLKLSSVKAVIPKGIKLTSEIRMSEEFWLMILSTMGTITLIRLMAFFLKFRKTTWQTLNISQIIIGMSTNQEPENWYERTVFGSLLIACIVYSGYFYSVILDIGFRTTPEISTLAELIKSNLTPMMDFAINYTLPNTTSAEIGKWITTSIGHARADQEYCLTYLRTYQNVTCVFDDAEYWVNGYQMKNSELNAKILPETIGNGATGFASSPHSKYVDRIDEILLRASDLGLMAEFYGQVAPHQRNPAEPEYITKEKLLPLLLCVLVGGYSLSMITFLLELITAKFRRMILKLKIRFTS